MSTFSRLSEYIGRIERRIALRYLNRMRTHHLQKYPQLVTFSFDFISNCIAVNGRYEDDFLNELSSIVSREKLSGIAIDVGANIGNHSLALADQFDRVISFEPNPRIFEILEINGRLRSNIRCFPYGLSDRDRRAAFWFDRKNYGGGSICQRESEDGAIETEVELRRLDSFLAGETKVGLIKLDVEGSEIDVLKGAAQLIERDRPAIVFEIMHSEINDGKSEVIDWLRSLNYTRFINIRGRSSSTLDVDKPLKPEFYQMVVGLN